MASNTYGWLGGFGFLAMSSIVTFGCGPETPATGAMSQAVPPTASASGGRPATPMAATGTSVPGVAGTGSAAAGSGVGLSPPLSGGAGGAAVALPVAAGAAAGAGARAGAGGMVAAAGAFAAAGGGGMLAGAAGQGSAGMSAPAMGKGMCCPSGDCLCHGDVPGALTSAAGPFQTKTLRVSTGTIHYPVGAEPPFAGVAVCGGFLNTGPEMETWGTFYASYGIVTIVTTTEGADLPDVRAMKLLGAIGSLKEENMKAGSPLMGAMSGRYGTSGYSMGGGGTTIATGTDTTLKTSVGMAPWGGVGTGVKTPTILFCGAADVVAPCDMASGAYRGIAAPTPKILVTLSGTDHLQWVGSNTAPGGGAAAKLALAFQKVYLEGDTRWKPLLGMEPTGVDSIMKANAD